MLSLKIKLITYYDNTVAPWLVSVLLTDILVLSYCIFKIILVNFINVRIFA